MCYTQAKVPPLLLVINAMTSSHPGFLLVSLAAPASSPLSFLRWTYF